MTPSDDPIDELFSRSRGPLARGLASLLSEQLTKANLGVGPAPHAGRYVIERKLGEGGLGTVFLGQDPSLQRQVAIKVLHFRRADGSQHRLRTEAQLLARLSHPNVLSVFDIGETNGQFWVATEYAGGGTLRQWCEAHPEANDSELLGLCVGAARGLAAAHRAGLIHRDIKPDNILVGTDGRVRIADFGLAESAGSLPDSVSFHPGLGPAGTPRYLPPELQAGHPHTPLSDQASFFMAIREVMCGREPACAAYAALVERGLSPDPTLRWPNMDVVAHRFEAMLSAPDADPHRDSLLERTREIWLSGQPLVSTAASTSIPLPLEVVRPPGSAHLHAPPQAAPLTTACLSSALCQATNGIVLVGEPGAGKTTALLTLLADRIKLASSDPGAPVPLMLNLASFGAERQTLEQWVAQELVGLYGLPRRRARALVRQGSFILLLDGLDEVSPGRRSDAVAAINTSIVDDDVQTVITCRLDAYEALATKPATGLALRLCPLDDKARGALWGECDAAAIAHLGLESEALRTPLAVALARSAIAGSSVAGQNEQGESDEPLRRQTSLYDVYISRALNRSPALAAPEAERMVQGLAFLASTMQRAAVSDMSLEKLQAHWLGSGALRFAARALGFTLVSSALFAVNSFANLLAERPAHVPTTLSVLGLVLVLSLNSGLSIRPQEAVRWSWRVSVRRLPILLALGAICALVFGYIYIFWVNLVLSAGAALALAVALGLEPVDSNRALKAGQGIIQSLRTSLRVAPITGVFTGLTVGYGAVSLVLPHVGPHSMLLSMSDPRFSLFATSAGFAAVVSGLAYGGTAVLLHVGLRLALVFGTPLPLKLAPWLNDAADRGLLKRVGGGWMFLHPTLAGHFASLNAERPQRDRPRP